MTRPCSKCGCGIEVSDEEIARIKSDNFFFHPDSSVWTCWNCLKNIEHIQSTLYDPLLRHDPELKVSREALQWAMDRILERPREAKSLFVLCKHCRKPQMNCDCDGQFEPLGG